MKVPTPFFFKFLDKQIFMKTNKFLSTYLIFLFCLTNVFQLRTESKVDFPDFNNYKNLQAELQKKKNEDRKILIIAGTSVAVILVGGFSCIYYVGKSSSEKIKNLSNKYDGLSQRCLILESSVDALKDEFEKYKNEIEPLIFNLKCEEEPPQTEDRDTENSNIDLQKSNKGSVRSKLWHFLGF